MRFEKFTARRWRPRVLARYDQDGNNVLDRGELTALLTELNDGNRVDPAEVEGVMFAPRRDQDSQRGLERCSRGATNLIEELFFRNDLCSEYI